MGGDVDAVEWSVGGMLEKRSGCVVCVVEGGEWAVVGGSGPMQFRDPYRGALAGGRGETVL